MTNRSNNCWCKKRRGEIYVAQDPTFALNNRTYEETSVQQSWQTRTRLRTSRVLLMRTFKHSYVQMMKQTDFWCYCGNKIKTNCQLLKSYSYWTCKLSPCKVIQRAEGKGKFRNTSPWWRYSVIFLADDSINLCSFNLAVLHSSQPDHLVLHPYFHPGASCVWLVLSLRGSCYLLLLAPLVK